MNSTTSGSDTTRERGLCGATTNNIVCTPPRGSDDDDTDSVGSIQYLFAKCCTSTKHVHDDNEIGDLRLRPDSPYDEADEPILIGGAPVVTPTATSQAAGGGCGEDDSSVSSDDTIDFTAEFAATVKQEEGSTNIKKSPSQKMSPYDKMQEIKDDQAAGMDSVPPTYQGQKKQKKKSPYQYDKMHEEEDGKKPLPRLVTPPRMRSDVQDSTFDNLPEYSPGTTTISAHKPSPNAKIGLIFSRQQHSKKKSSPNNDQAVTMIARVTNECIFTSHHTEKSLEGATVLAVNGIAVDTPRHAAELVCGALAGTVSLTIKRGGATNKVTSPKEKIGMLPKVPTDVTDPQIEEYDSDENNSTGQKKAETEGVAAACAVNDDNDDDAHSTSEFSTAEWSAADVVENAFAFPKDDGEDEASVQKNAGLPNKKERDAIATSLPETETSVNFSAPVNVNDDEDKATKTKGAKKSKMSSIKKRVSFGIIKHSSTKDGAKAVVEQPTHSDVAATPIVVSAEEIMHDLISLASSNDDSKKEVKAEGEQRAEEEPAAEQGTNIVPEILSQTVTADVAKDEATSNPLEEITMATERATSYILEHIVSNLSSGCDDPISGSKVLVVEDGKFHYPNDSSSSEVSSKESSAVGGEGGDSSANISDSSDAEQQSAGSEVKTSQEVEEKTKAKKKSFFKRAFSKKSKQQQPLVVSDEQGDEITPQAEDSSIPELDKDAVAKSMEAAVMNDQDDSQIDNGQEKNNDEALAEETSSNEDGVTQVKKKKSFLKLFKKSNTKKPSELVEATTPVNDPVENEANETLDEESIVPFDLDVTLTGDVEVHTPSKQPILFDCSLSPIRVTSPSKIDKRTGSHTTASVSMTDESNSTYDKHATTTTTPEDARLSAIQPTAPPTPSKIGESWNMSLLFGLSGPPSPSESIIGGSPSSFLGSTPVSVKKTPSIEGIGGPESFECRLDDDNSTGQDRVNVSMELYSNEETNNTGSSGSDASDNTDRHLHAPPPVNRKLDFDNADENFGAAFNDTMCQAPFQSKAIDVTTVYTVDDSSLVARDTSLVRAPSNDIAEVDETLQLAQAKKDAFDIASEARRELKNSTKGQFSIGLLKRRLFEREAVEIAKNNAIDTTHVTADLTQDASMAMNN